MEDQELLKEKMEQGFLPCFNHSCERRESCLHWLGRVYVSTTSWVVECVSPANPDACGNSCVMYRHHQKVRMARGFTGLLGRMPRNMGQELMREMKATCHRTYAYEYRNGSRPMPPRMQDSITATCRRLGYDGDVTFDRYEEDYEW